MRIVSIPVNKEVVSIDTGDFNADGKPDLVFYGTPAEVVILFNEGKGRFGNPKKINTGDAVQKPGGSPSATSTRTVGTTWPCWVRTS